MKTVNNYSEILRKLSEGYPIAKSNKTYDFFDYLKASNLSLKEAAALNQYSSGSNMILSIEKGITKDEIYLGIKREFTNKLYKRGLELYEIENIFNYLVSLDYNLPLHCNFTYVKEKYKEEYKSFVITSINKAVKDLNSLFHIEETISTLKNVLLSSEIQENLVVFRGLKGDAGNPEKFMKNHKIKGIISSSMDYESSFAKYPEYKTVIKLIVPKGTKGIVLTPFSDYEQENEVLLYADVTFLGYSNIKGKTIFNGYCKNIKQTKIKRE